MNHHPKTEVYGYTVALLGGIFLSFDTTLLRMINLPCEQVAFWRALSLAFPMMLIFSYRFLCRQKLPLASGLLNKDIFLSSLLYGLSSVLFPISAMLTSISNMLFIISTAPLWAGVFAWVFLREPMNKIALLSFLMSIAGVLIVICGTGQGVSYKLSLGDLTSLLTAITMAAAFVVGRASQHDVSLSPSIGAVLAAALLYIFFDIRINIPLHTLLLVAVEGSIVVFVALSLIAKASHIIPSAHLGLFLLIETVLGPLWIYAFFGEVPGTYSILGGMMILMALITNSAFSIYALNNKK